MRHYSPSEYEEDSYGNQEGKQESREEVIGKEDE